MKNVKKEVADLTASVQFLSDKMETSNNLMKELKSELAAVKEENQKLHANCDTLNAEVGSLRQRLRELEQYTRRNNIEICGIPLTPSENILTIVKDVGATLDVDFNESQVSAAHRIPSYNKENSQSIVVQFHSRITRDTWIRQFREKKSVSANQVNPVFPKQALYVNEHLSPQNKMILGKLQQKCRDVGYTYVWWRDGKFFVRRNPRDACKRINNLDKLNKLK